MIALTDSQAISDLDQRLVLALKDSIYRVVGNDTTGAIVKADIFSKPTIDTKPGRGPFVNLRFTIEVEIKP